MTRYEARFNPFPPEPEQVGMTADGEPLYGGEKVVEIDGDLYLYDDLDVDRLLKLFGIKPKQMEVST